MAATSIVRRIEGMMSPGKSLEAAALAFPGKVERALAAIDEEPEARELMGKADALSRYAKRIKVDTDTLNHIQHGRLLVGAKLGELMPREPGKGGGRGNKKPPTCGVGGFNPNTMSCLRKLNDHRERIGETQYDVALKALIDAQDRERARQDKARDKLNELDIEKVDAETAMNRATKAASDLARLKRENAELFA